MIKKLEITIFIICFIVLQILLHSVAASPTPSVLFTSNVTRLHYGTSFSLECSISSFSDKGHEYYSVTFMKSEGSIATFTYKRPEPRLPPQLFFIITFIEGMSVQAKANSAFPTFGLNIRPRAIRVKDTYWCEFQADKAEPAIRSNSWHSNSAQHSGIQSFSGFAVVLALSWCILL